jgi:adenylosuccinate synthase
MPVRDFDPAALQGVQCVYETMPGWKREISDTRRFEDLPIEARRYVQAVEGLIARPVGFIGVGADRQATITHNTRVRGFNE